MKVTILVDEVDDETGEAIAATAYSREGVEDLQEWLWFLSEATRKAGFSYVEAIGALYNDETETWSTF